MTFTDQCNSQMQHQVATAFDIGMQVPEILFLGALDLVRREQIIYDRSWDIVSPLGMAMKKIEGIELTASAWWSGDHFDFFTLSIQDRAVMNGGQGPALNANISTMWSGRMEHLKKAFKNLSKKIIEKEPEFRGFVNIEVTLNDNKAFYRRLYFGATYDFLYSIAALHHKHLDILFDEAGGHPHGFVSAVRLYSYPYHVVSNKKIIDDLREDVDLPDLSEGDESYICIRRGDKIRDSWDSIYHDLDGLQKHGVCYRTDGSTFVRTIYNDVKRKQYA